MSEDFRLRDKYVFLHPPRWPQFFSTLNDVPPFTSQEFRTLGTGMMDVAAQGCLRFANGNYFALEGRAEDGFCLMRFRGTTFSLSRVF